MNKTGNMRLKWELEKFVVTRLKYIPEFFYRYEYDYRCEYENNVKERFWIMDKIWEQIEYRNREYLRKLVDFPQLTNHDICHEMFWNAFRGRSKMFIQIQDFRFDDYTFPNKSNEIIEGNTINVEYKKEVITLQCSLLTLQMLDYDIMMFKAMSDVEDEDYRNAAQQYYRPYLFSFVAEIDREKYQELQILQRNLAKSKQDQLDMEDEPSYLWLACTFNPNIDVPHVELDGYVVLSASNIDKIIASLSIIKDEMTPVETINSILDGYTMRSSCIKDDDTFNRLIEIKLGHDCLSTIDVYKIGNGNCVFAQSDAGDESFFYDIGFNYKHLPQKISPGVTYNYSKTMKQIVAKKPSFFILSHWDMDHIAGSAIASKDWFEKDWFAPDCFDACTDAKRLAKYLDLKGHLYLAKRCPRERWTGRLIGRQIEIKSISLPSQTLATYRLYMGKKDSCDSSYSNCEGIVIEYTDEIKNKKVLMMGDVNYASFNKARSTITTDPSFSNTQIDYLIVPHHGSEHTDYMQITNNGTILKKGKQAIICCTNETKNNRPNDEHFKELKKRFGDDVITTEEANSSDVSIIINL